MPFTRRQLLQSSLAAAAFGTGISASTRAAEPKHPAWLADVQRAPQVLPPDTPKLASVLRDAAGQPITTREAWEKRRAEIRRDWLDFLGPPPAERKAAPKLEVIESDRVGSVVRERVRYEIEPGIMSEAYLVRPEKVSGKAPGVAVFHSTIHNSIRQPAGLGKDPEKAFALKLAERGCITFSPRNFLWPENDKLSAKPEAEAWAKRMPKSRGMAKMLYDAQVAVDILLARSDVDPARIGSVGHSLGAKEVLYLAAFDERVTATVSSEGGIGMTFTNWNDLWYLGPEVKAAGFARDHHDLLALAAPRAFLLLGGDSADGRKSWPYIARGLEVYRLYGEPARLGLFVHDKGHAMPPEAEEKTYGWLAAYLGL